MARDCILQVQKYIQDYPVSIKVARVLCYSILATELLFVAWIGLFGFLHRRRITPFCKLMLTTLIICCVIAIFQAAMFLSATNEQSLLQLEQWDLTSIPQLYYFGDCSIGFQLVFSTDDFFQHLAGLILAFKYHSVALTVESIVLSHSLPEARKLQLIKRIYTALFSLILACLVVTVACEVFSEYITPMPSWLDFVVVLGAVIMALLLASYISSFVKLNRAFKQATDKQSNFKLHTICLCLFFVIIVTQLVYYTHPSLHWFSVLMAIRQASKMLLRIMYACLLQKFGQDVEYTSQERSSGEIEIRGTCAVTGKSLFVYVIANDENTSSAETNSFLTSSTAKTTVTCDRMEDLQIAQQFL